MSTTSMATGNYTGKLFSELQNVVVFSAKISRSVEALTAVPCHGENTPTKKQITINLDSALLSND